MARLEEQLSPEQRAVLTGLDTPYKIQAYLDDTPYSVVDDTRCPLRVMQDRVAHCYDGGMFAASALRRLGYPPVVVVLLPEPGTDDDHMLAIFREGRLWGAVAKSNFTGLRYRDPVYRSLRELVMSYFEVYYNVDGMKTLRAHTPPLDLAAFDRYDWETTDAGALMVENYLPRLRTYRLLPPGATERLSPVDRLSYEAGMLATNPAGLYKKNSKP